jgi:hypothetical protein
LERLLTRRPEDYENSSEFWLHLQLAGGWWPKLRCAASYALLPTDSNGAVLKLSPPLYFLYYPYRQVCLGLKYGTRLLQSGLAAASAKRG